MHSVSVKQFDVKFGEVDKTMDLLNYLSLSWLAEMQTSF